MTGIGLLMYVDCPFLFQMLTYDLRVQKLVTEVLRIESFAEPLYAVSIVASGALRGAGHTKYHELGQHMVRSFDTIPYTCKRMGITWCMVCYVQ